MCVSFAFVERHRAAVVAFDLELHDAVAPLVATGGLDPVEEGPAEADASTFLLDGHELKMRDAVVVGDDPGRGDDAVVLLAVGHNHRDVPDGVRGGLAPLLRGLLVVRDGAKDAHHLPVARLVLTEPISPAVTRRTRAGVGIAASGVRSRPRRTTFSRETESGAKPERAGTPALNRRRAN